MHSAAFNSLDCHNASRFLLLATISFLRMLAAISSTFLRVCALLFCPKPLSGFCFKHRSRTMIWPQATMHACSMLVRHFRCRDYSTDGSKQAKAWGLHQQRESISEHPIGLLPVKLHVRQPLEPCPVHTLLFGELTGCPRIESGQFL